MKNATILFLPMVILFSCIQENKLKVNGQLESFGQEDMVFSSLINEISDTLTFDDNGYFDHSFVVKNPLFIYLSAGKMNQLLYLSPGKDFSISEKDEVGRNFTFTGPGSKENIWLQEYVKLVKEADEKYPLMSISGLEPDSFLKQLDGKYSSVDSLLALIVSDSSEEYFVDALKKRLNLAKVYHQLTYPRMFTYFNKKSAPLPEDYYSFLENHDFDDPVYLQFEEGIHYLRPIMERNIDVSSIKSKEEYLEILPLEIEKFFEHADVRKYVKYHYLHTFIEMDGRSGQEAMINDFFNDYPGSMMVKQLEILLSMWDRLEKGQLAPGFDGKTPDGKIVHINDLQGQYVYIDVWATWCGPCLAEIPPLKDLEKKYHGSNIVFLGVSIDQEKDRQKWKSFLIEREIPGLQIMEENDWSSEIAKNYNIKGIPRYILIDPQGTIITANAPRPSNPELVDLFSELGI
ncbi:MAG TPA: TlpA disulfide reductase family protein [Saprospiraceae bacterium]|nr:TlpA disulfide reductase family protein [Saprospiraceae bacterium]